MTLKEFAAERKWKFKFLLILIGLVVCTGSDLWVKAIVEKVLAYGKQASAHISIYYAMFLFVE